MREADSFTESPFTLHRLEEFSQADHSLRAIRQRAKEALKKMDALFASLYEAPSKGGRPSIAPEKLLPAMLLHVFCSMRSKCQLLEQFQYKLVYCWFIGLAMKDALWVAGAGCIHRIVQPSGAKRIRVRLAFEPARSLHGTLI